MEMDEKKKELIEKASDVYMRFGIKSVTMDEMARQLGVSKKTIYQYVKDKNDLVEQCLWLSHKQEEEEILRIANETTNAIEEILKISRFVIKTLEQIHPSIFFDLEKYHPSAMQMMQCHKDDFICGCIEQNLVNGIDQGLYRKNLNPKIISDIYVGMIDMLLGNQLKSSELRPDQIYSEMFRYHVRGIATEKGLNYLKKLVEKDEYLSLGL